MTDDRRALYFGLAAVLFWSTAATAFKLALRTMDVPQLLAWAVCSSAIALWLIVVAQGKLGLVMQYLRTSPLYFLFMGLVNPLLFYLVLLRAYELLPAQQAQTINFTWAVTLAVLAVPILGHRLGWRDVVAVLLGYGGVVIIATRGRVLAMEFDSVEGVICALASTVIWALYWLAKTGNERDPIASLCLNFSLAAPLALLLCGVLSSLALPPWPGLAAAIYVGLFEMGVTFALWSTALRLSSGVSRVGNLIFLSPIVSLVFIATILGEPIDPATLAGLALIVPGVLLQQVRPAAAPAPD
jgi:drug/metabolite transporter (DMT)-like permease